MVFHGFSVSVTIFLKFFMDFHGFSVSVNAGPANPTAEAQSSSWSSEKAALNARVASLEATNGFGFGGPPGR